MGLWGVSTTAESRPKFLKEDSNAVGAGGARENAIAVKAGWALQPGTAASGNDNTSATPEVLVCIGGLSDTFSNASALSVDFATGAVADAADFDITVTFDEAVTVTSAAATANNTITNKAYLFLDMVGGTDMASDDNIMCQYHSGSGTNQLTFRGRAATNDNGFIALGNKLINFDGTSAAVDGDNHSILNFRLNGTDSDGTDANDRIILNATAAITAKTNGTLTGAGDATSTLVVDNNSGTIATNQVVLLSTGANPTFEANVRDGSDQTEFTQVTVTAVASQNSVTVAPGITVGNNVDLIFAPDGNDGLTDEAIDLEIAGVNPGVDNGSDLFTLAKTGEDDNDNILLESSSSSGGFDGDTDGRIVLNASDGSSSDELGGIQLQDFNSSRAGYTQAGTSSGSATVLTGVTTT